MAVDHTLTVVAVESIDAEFRFGDAIHCAALENASGRLQEWSASVKPFNEKWLGLERCL